MGLNYFFYNFACPPIASLELILYKKRKMILFLIFYLYWVALAGGSTPTPGGVT